MFSSIGWCEIQVLKKMQVTLVKIMFLKPCRKSKTEEILPTLTQSTLLVQNSLIQCGIDGQNCHTKSHFTFIVLQS